MRDHPDWFKIRPDGTIQYAENPPKKYQDIYPINFESNDWHALWQELYSVFAFWIDKGVRIFRVDNPHTKALPFWEWCIAEVRKANPDVIFLAEAFTRPHVMYGLAKAGYTQSYTYFSWRTEKKELTEYMTEVTTAPVADFFRGQFVAQHAGYPARIFANGTPRRLCAARGAGRHARGELRHLWSSV